MRSWSGKGDAIAGAAMGRAKMLSETLATVEGVLGIDLRDLSQNVAAKLTSSEDKPKNDAPLTQKK